MSNKILNNDETKENLIIPKHDNLPDPDELALEIVENLEAGLLSFKEIIAVLNEN